MHFKLCQNAFTRKLVLFLRIMFQVSYLTHHRSLKVFTHKSLLLCGLCFLVPASVSAPCFSLCLCPWVAGIQEFGYLWLFCPKYFLDFVFTLNPNEYSYFCSSLPSLLLVDRVFFELNGLLRKRWWQCILKKKKAAK